MLSSLYRNVNTVRHWNAMIEIDAALRLKKRALAAVAELDGIVNDIRGHCSEDDFEIIRRGVGLSVGRIVTDVLEPVLLQHPEIDDLK